jgi:hypothetical protein
VLRKTECRTSEVRFATRLAKWRKIIACRSGDAYYLNVLVVEGSTMADDPKKNGPEDASRVNIHQEHEVRYWCSKFGCTEAELREAVKAVGTSAAAVGEYLAKKKK